MIKKILNKKQILIWIVSLMPLLLVMALYHRLPDQIPTNWGVNGEVTYGGKQTVWLMAGLAPLSGVLCAFLPWIDPKRRNWQKFLDVYQDFQLFIQVFLLVMTGIILIESFHPGTIQVSMVVCILCGVLFVMIGNMMPKFRQNFYCGIRTPWALSSELVWTKTHRLGGRLYVAAGIIGILGAFLSDDRWKMTLLLGPVLAASLIPAVMSYVWYQQLMKNAERIEE